MANKNEVVGDKRSSICFVGLDNYAFLRPELELPHMGGEAVQQGLLARHFAAQGHTISTVVSDHGQANSSEIDGIRIIRASKPGAGVKGLRFFHPRLSRLWKALRRANADVYYQSPAGVVTGVTAAYCQLYQKKFIFRIASDADCIRGKQMIGYWRDRRIFEYGLRRADLRAAQTERQRTLLSHQYGLDSVIVNMVTEPAERGKCSQKDVDVLWVNNLKTVKRPDRVIRVARSLPDYRFVMIGGAGRGSDDLFNRIEREAAKTSNIEFLGSRPYSDVNEWLRRSKLLLNTSDLEGFPNTFLQAWMRGVPVVSTFDPDDLIKSRNMGAATSNSEELPDLIKKFLVDDRLLSEHSERVARFAKQDFSPDFITRQYLDLIG